MEYRRKKFYKLATGFVFLMVFSQTVFAGMTISGTRVIFPGGEREQTVRTTNKGKTPLLVQVWVDDGGMNDDINSIKVPFTATPPVYRVEPGKGQSVRLIYNGMSLPQDRESVFWFNMLEIPPVNDDEKKTDRLELAFRTRIKIFYRPPALKSGSVQEAVKLRWETIPTAKGMKITNPTPYYYSFDSAALLSGARKLSLSTELIEPFSTKEFMLEKKESLSGAVTGAMARLINDYGSIVEYQLIPAAGNTLLIEKAPH